MSENYCQLLMYKRPQAVFAHLQLCHSAHVAVRREIESLNERLTGDGQAVEGADATKGALKAKG